MDWDTYNSAEAHGTATGEGQDIFGDLSVEVEITAVDAHMVEVSFSGRKIAGDEVSYKWNRYGQLVIDVKGYVAKGSLRKSIMKALLTTRKYFVPVSEEAFNNQWTLTRGVLFPDDGDHEVGVLTRGQNVIGIFRKGSDISRTMEWYEKMVYKSTAWKSMRVGKLIDYKPEFHLDDDIYAQQEPEFTREEELEEICAFVSSMQGRKRSASEQIILGDLRAILDGMV